MSSKAVSGVSRKAPSSSVAHNHSTSSAAASTSPGSTNTSTSSGAGLHLLTGTSLRPPSPKVEIPNKIGSTINRPASRATSSSSKPAVGGSTVRKSPNHSSSQSKRLADKDKGIDDDLLSKSANFFEDDREVASMMSSLSEVSFKGHPAFVNMIAAQKSQYAKDKDRSNATTPSNAPSPAPSITNSNSNGVKSRKHATVATNGSPRSSPTAAVSLSAGGMLSHNGSFMRRNNASNSNIGGTFSPSSPSAAMWDAHNASFYSTASAYSMQSMQSIQSMQSMHSTHSHTSNQSSHSANKQAYIHNSNINSGNNNSHFQQVYNANNRPVFNNRNSNNNNTTCNQANNSNNDGDLLSIVRSLLPNTSVSGLQSVLAVLSSEISVRNAQSSDGSVASSVSNAPEKHHKRVLSGEIGTQTTALSSQLLNEIEESNDSSSDDECEAPLKLPENAHSAVLIGFENTVPFLDQNVGNNATNGAHFGGLMTTNGSLASSVTTLETLGITSVVSSSVADVDSAVFCAQKSINNTSNSADSSNNNDLDDFPELEMMYEYYNYCNDETKRARNTQTQAQNAPSVTLSAPIRATTPVSAITLHNSNNNSYNSSTAVVSRSGALPPVSKMFDESTFVKTKPPISIMSAVADNNPNNNNNNTNNSIYGESPPVIRSMETLCRDALAALLPTKDTKEASSHTSKLSPKLKEHTNSGNHNVPTIADTLMSLKTTSKSEFSTHHGPSSLTTSHGSASKSSSALFVSPRTAFDDVSVSSLGSGISSLSGNSASISKAKSNVSRQSSQNHRTTNQSHNNSHSHTNNTSSNGNYKRHTTSSAAAMAVTMAHSNTSLHNKK